MGHNKLTIEQKKANTDLWIILIVTFAVLGTYMSFNSSVNEFTRNGEIPIIIRTLCIALFQFGVAGLGITIVCMLRRESFFKFGLHKKNLFITLVLSTLMFVPNLIFSIVTGAFTGYFPFQQVWMTEELLTSAIAIRFIGMLIIIIAWGFFEGFNYVVIMDKINTRYQSKNKWLDTGAISCAIMCILIHGAIGVTPKDFIEMVTVLIIVYGMLMVRKFTGNAWGAVFVFIFLWNAY